MYWNMTDKNRLLQFIRHSINKKSLSSNQPSDQLLLYKFLNELLTKKEFEDVVRRLQAMCLLYDGAPYIEITNLTGLSSATIARLSKNIKTRDGGFRNIIESFENKNKTHDE